MTTLTRVIHTTGLLLILPGTFATTALSQEPGEPDSLKAAALCLRRGDVDRAKGIYEGVLHADRRSFAAHLGLGRVALEQRDWGEACDQFDDAADRDTGNMAARYYGGIARREYGAQVAWLLRQRQWRKAQENFEWVIARDSLYEDVLYQLALLYRYRDDLERALDLGRLQIDLRPHLYGPALGLFKMYRYAVAVTPAPEIYKLLDGRRDPLALYFTAEALRRERRYQDAERILNELLQHGHGVPLQAACLSFARIRFAFGDDATGESLYWRGVDRIDSWLGAAVLFEDIKYIVTDAEIAKYDSLVSDRKKALFFHLFWNLRNPSPASRTNVRLAEHERRIVTAEREFEYYGFRTHFNDPDKLHYLHFPRAFLLNEEFNDKGLIYIRHGPPDDVQRTIGEELNESWLYNAREGSPRRMFYFTQNNSAGNNWRLTSFPDDPRMWEDLVMWDQTYSRLLNGDAMEQGELEDRLRDESTTMVAGGLSSDEHRWKKDTKVFAMPHTLASFRTVGGKTLVNVSYALPAGEIADALPDSVRDARVEVGISMNRQDGTILASSLDTLSLPRGAGEAESFIDLYRFTVSPDSVRIAMMARPLGADMASNWNMRVRLPSFPAGLPIMSDVEYLLPSGSKSSIDIEGLKVIASPFDQAPRNKPLYVYWQAYNLTKDIDGKTAWRSRVLLTPGEDGPDETSVVVYQKDHTGDDETAAELAKIDLAPISTGTYTVTVEVTDRKMVRTFSRSRGLTITGD
ncbi:MAG TPA: GWxTD domain-containing protein [Bacteroidota bacterium]|nr:GWxTD domain-containing protein [Bacteroidota bacterium]